MHKMLPILFFAVALWLAPQASAQEKEAGGYADPPMPAFRVDPAGFGSSSQEDMHTLAVSAGRELWQWFPEYEIEPFVISRGNKGPIVLFKRNDRGEIVMRLDTQDRLWAQFSYQFAHEFCHILCVYREEPTNNKWFEETLCETASLYVMRAMARAWEQDPPYRNWVDYRHALKKYADEIMAGREQIGPEDLAGYYQKHREKLEADDTLRELNGAMSLVLLKLVEAKPEHWESIRWLNASEPKKRNFTQYLQAWHDEAPKRHHGFIQRIAELYGIKLQLPSEVE